MRLPLSSDAASRDGAANKDERLTNVLSENDEGVALAVIRPGLTTIATVSGNGGGMVRFNDKLISVFGTSVKFGAAQVSIDTVTAGFYDFAQSPL